MHPPSSFRWRPPLVVAGSYLAFGLLWILLSDWAVQLMVTHPDEITRLQTWKGITFVALSTLLVVAVQARETARTRARERDLELTRHALETSFDEILRVDAQGTIRDANQTACDNLGFHRDELIGRTINEVAPQHDLDHYRSSLWPRVRAEGKIAVETTHRTRNGREYPVEAGLSRVIYRGEEFLYSVARDISRRKAAETSYRRSNRALRALSRANTALVHAEHETELLDEVCRALTETGGYTVAWVGLLDEAGAGALRVAGAAGAERKALAQVAHHCNPQVALRNPTIQAMTEGRTRVLEDLAAAHTDWSAAEKACLALTTGGMVALPLHSSEGLEGVLTVHALLDHDLDAEEMALLEELAADLGFGLRTLRLHAERDRQLAELRLAGAVFENTTEGIVVTDPEQRIQRVNPAFTAITGYPAEEVIGRSPSVLHSGLQDEAFYQDLWASIRQSGHWQGEIWNRRKNGEIYPELLSIAEVHDDDQRLAHYIATFADVSQAHNAREELTYRTYHDPLTDLPNRELFRERLQRALESEQSQLALLFIDLKGFRALNDSVGSEAGDTILRRVASRLREAVGDQDTVARVGGDEFWLLLHGARAGRSVDDWVDHLLAVLARPLELDLQTVRLEANMGVTLAPDDATEMEALLTNAATALHRAQAENGGQVHYFRPEMQAAVQQRVRLEEGLKVAIENDELRVWFQPQVDLARRSLEGLEALVRWEHPEWGMVSPGEFIPVAERTGQVVAIGDWVLETALARLAAWRDEGYLLPRVAVNMAAAQLQRPDSPDQVAAALRRHGLPPEKLELEITEEGLMTDPEAVSQVMRRLRALGVRLAIDDFGTGYSSLAYLKTFPVHTLKIDKSFVDGLPGEDDKNSIIEAILAVAGALHQEVVAEGVETGEQAKWLRDRQVTWAQGFYYYRPQPHTGIADLLTRAAPEEEGASTRLSR